MRLRAERIAEGGLDEIALGLVKIPIEEQGLLSLGDRGAAIQHGQRSRQKERDEQHHADSRDADY